MRIALDARTIYRPTRRGTGKNLIDLYSQVAQTHPDWTIHAFCRHTENLPDVLPAPNIHRRCIEMPGDRFDLWERCRLPWTAWQQKVDLLHCPANTCPAWMPVRTLVTIHDLIPLDMPTSTHDSRYFQKCIVRACQQAAGIITPSVYTRDRLVSDFHADPKRITVNPWAPDQKMRYVPFQEAIPVFRRYEITRPYILHFGAADPRKNTRAMIEAWAMLPRKLRKLWQLLIIGLDDDTRKQIAIQASRLGLHHSLNLKGFADEADIPALLSGAQILAYPSLSEGFGLPILDAWVAHTAVLCSDVTSLPEVAGNAAALINPMDTGTITAGLRRLMKDRFYRQQLVARGDERVKQYTWQATTQRFLQAAQQACEVPMTSLRTRRTRLSRRRAA